MGTLRHSLVQSVEHSLRLIVIPLVLEASSIYPKAAATLYGAVRSGVTRNSPKMRPGVARNSQKMRSGVIETARKTYLAQPNAIPKRCLAQPNPIPGFDLWQ